jgi:hypothetical protein
MKVSEVRSSRESDYGSPAENMEIQLRIFHAYFQHKPASEFTRQDMAMIGIIIKLARQSFKHKEDNLIDIAGWADVANKV